jgi:mannan endo-1,4-beta-mannosidase
MRKTTYKSLVILLLSTSLFSCKSKQDFIKVTATTFTQKSKSYYFVGTNFWYGAYLGADAAYGNRARLIRELNQLQKLGITNLRIVAASEESDYGLPLSPPFQYKNGQYNETLLQGLDYLLYEMRKRNMRATLVLNNNWDWTGGMGQYVSWTTNKPVIDPATNKNQTWDEVLKFAAGFYTNQKAQTLYRKYINMIVYRKNVYTRTLYNNDPTIMSWELANEPRPLNIGNLDENVKVFANWVDETAAFIHANAPNQLVTTGSEGSKGSLNDLGYTLKVHESKYVDYMTFHMWPKKLGWYKADQPETMERTKKNTVHILQNI